MHSLPTYPLLRQRDRGSHAGCLEIVFSESQYWGEAQTFVSALIKTLGMKLIRRCDGPDAWLWDVKWNGKGFTFGYDDFPCETVLFPATASDQNALHELFEKIRGECNASIL